MIVDKLPLLIIATELGMDSSIEAIDELAGDFIKSHRKDLIDEWCKLLRGMKEHGEFSFTEYTEDRFKREAKAEMMDYKNYKFLEIVRNKKIYKDEYKRLIGDIK